MAMSIVHRAPASRSYFGTLRWRGLAGRGGVGHGA